MTNRLDNRVNGEIVRRQIPFKPQDFIPAFGLFVREGRVSSERGISILRWYSDELSKQIYKAEIPILYKYGQVIVGGSVLGTLVATAVRYFGE